MVSKQIPSRSAPAGTVEGKENSTPIQIPPRGRAPRRDLLRPSILECSAMQCSIAQNLPDDVVLLAVLGRAFAWSGY